MFSAPASQPAALCMEMPTGASCACCLLELLTARASRRCRVHAGREKHVKAAGLSPAVLFTSQLCQDFERDTTSVPCVRIRPELPPPVPF